MKEGGSERRPKHFFTCKHLCFLLLLLLPPLQSNIAVYELETGEKRFEIAVATPERCVLLVRHLLPLGNGHIACSIGRDIQIVPCAVKEKVD